MKISKMGLLAFAIVCTMGWDCNGQANATGKGGNADASAVKVSSYDTVSLNVQDTDLAQVIQLLSLQGKRNIVPSPNVAGTVTANLYDVTFYEALDAILKQNGAGYVEEGNFIYIYTTDELARIEAANRKLDHRVFTLDYITSQDAETLVKPVLSGEGSLTITAPVEAGFEATVSSGGENTFANFETLIIYDYEENIEEAASIIEQIDVQPQQILIEATILIATVKENMALGVDMSILANVGLNDVMSPFGGIGDVESGVTGNAPLAGLSSSQSIGTNASDVKLGILTNSVQIFISALDDVTDTTTLANPKVTTLNRQRADVLVGRRSGYVSSTQETTSTTQTVEFLETGTQLTVRPFVSKDGMVRMEIRPKISEADISEVGGVVIPNEITQQLTTNVMVRDGQTIVLGGLFTDKTTTQNKQVPGLGNIPILGNAFKGQKDVIERTEIIFLITPHIITSQASAEVGQETMVGVEGMRVGMREGLLPFSRTKLTASHLRDALSYANAGENDKALWEVDMALSINPNSPDARRLKSKLSGEGVYWPNSSLLDGAVNEIVKERTGKNPQSFLTLPKKAEAAPAQQWVATPAYSPEVTVEEVAPAANSTASTSSLPKTIWPVAGEEAGSVASVPTER